MLRIPFVFLGDALLPVDVPPLQVCPGVGYLRPGLVYLAAGLVGVGVEEGRQLLLRLHHRLVTPSDVWFFTILNVFCLRPVISCGCDTLRLSRVSKDVAQKQCKSPVAGRKKPLPQQTDHVSQK